MSQTQQSIPRMRERLREMQMERQAGFIGAYTLAVADLVPGLLDRIEVLERQMPELPAITLPWTGHAGRVEVDEDGYILLELNAANSYQAGDGLALDADEATEAAAALLAAAAASREITGETHAIMGPNGSALTAPVATAAPVGPWRWELQIGTDYYPRQWEIRSSADLAAASNPTHLARLIADRHLEDRPAELRDTLWRVLVWESTQTTRTVWTACAVLGPGPDGTVGSWPGQPIAVACLADFSPPELPRGNSTPADATVAGA